MKLPSHVLTKLCLAGVVGTVGAAIGCESANRVDSREPVIEERAEPVIVEEEITVVPSFAQPPPGATRVTTPPAPPPVQVKKARPKPRPQPVHANNCGPCGMG